MALSSRSVNDAKRILWQVFPNTAQQFLSIRNGEDEEAFAENLVVGYDRKIDGGYENVFANIRDIQPDQIKQFYSLAETIHNSTFCRELKEAPGVTRIGWF